MDIESRVNEIRRLKKINGLQDLPADIRQAIIELKRLWQDKFGYIPSIKESVHILQHKLVAPPKCKKECCANDGVFNNTQYQYCSRYCSDTDPTRNKNIQTKRKPKIDYIEVHKKTVATKHIIGDDGISTHQRSANKSIATRNINYDDWYEKTSYAIGQKSAETKATAAKKRVDTLQEKYGVGHFGGGNSKLKQIEIFGKLFLCQGYEDILIYELIESGISPDDIIPISRLKKYSTKYEYNGKISTYYPDVYVISTNTLYEVKSLYHWEKEKSRNEIKLKSVPSSYHIVLKIYDDLKYVKNVRKIILNANTSLIPLVSGNKAKRTRMHPVSCNGILYPSVKAAQLALNVSKDYITHRCKSDRYPTYFYMISAKIPCTDKEEMEQPLTE